MGLFNFGSAGGLGLVLVFVIIALSTPGWVYVTAQIQSARVNQTETAAFGLFYSVPELINSSNIDYGKGLYLAGTSSLTCICFLCIGLSFVTVGALANIYSGAFEEEKKLAKVGGIFGLVAGLFLTVGMATLTGMVFDNKFFVEILSNQIFMQELEPTLTVDYAWGYSFGFGWAAMAVSIVSGAIGLLG